MKYLILLALYKFQLVIDAISNKITLLIEEYNQEVHYQNHKQELINKINSLPDPDPGLEDFFDINDKSAKQDYEAFVAAMKGHIV